MSQGRTVAALLGSAVAFGALVAVIEGQGRKRAGPKPSRTRAARRPVTGPGEPVLPVRGWFGMHPAPPTLL